MHSTVNELLEIETNIVATITASLDRRRPANHEDRIGPRNLVADANRQVLLTRAPTRGSCAHRPAASAVAGVDRSAGARQGAPRQRSLPG